MSSNVTRANQAFINDTSVVSYLDHAKMIGDKADHLLSNSQQFFPSEKKTGEKIDTEDTRNFKDEKRLIEEQYPKTEQKVTESPLSEAVQELEKDAASLPDIQNINSQKPSLITTSPIEIPVESETQNPITVITSDVAERVTNEVTEQTILPSTPTLNFK